VLSHDRPGNFPDINIAARIDGDPVRRDELTGCFAGVDIAESREAFAFLIIDIDPVP
jgi:hypothetical protein